FSSRLDRSMTIRFPLWQRRQRPTPTTLSSAHQKRIRSGLQMEPLEARELLSGMNMASGEMAATLALVPDSAVTATAAGSGAWSTPATWQDGRAPTANANVLIPTGNTVTLDTATSPLHTLRVDGTLQFAAAQNTALVVDTLVVNMQGVLVIGTPV